MAQSRFALSLLRVPLAWKIAGANALLTIALVVGFALLPASAPDLASRSSLALVVLLAAAAVNVVLITVALDPIRDLERTAEMVWSGETEIRARPSRLADRDLRRVAQTVDSLLERLAADRARLQQLTAQLVEARASERAAIARELTESVAQLAAGLALECASLKSSDNGQNAERFERMAQTAMSLVDEIRRIARDVHPRHIDELGLDVALRSLAREAQTVKTQVKYSATGLTATSDHLPREVAGALYDVAREGLKNSRQSGAQQVNVSLGVQRHAVTLRVSDDGCGFDPHTIPANQGTGLSTIRERVSLVGGTLEIESARGKGTTLIAIVPLVTPTTRQQPYFITTPQQESLIW